MAKIDLETLNLNELQELMQDAEKAMQAAKVKRKKEALAAVKALAKDYGFELSELMNEAKPTATGRTPAAPKYRHPDDASVTWSGRGRRPVWFIEALEKGVDPSDLEI